MILPQKRTIVLLCSIWCFIFVWIFSFVFHTSPSSPDILSLKWEYPLETLSSRFDYQTFGSGWLLLINHMGSNSVLVYDTLQHTLIQEIQGIGSPRGIAFSPKYNRIYVSSPTSDEVFVIDGQTWKIQTHILVWLDPDGVTVDDDHDKVFVTNESGESISVVDQIKLQETKKIVLSGTVWNTQYDSLNKLVYSVIHNGTFVVIDPIKETILQTIPLTNCWVPHGFSFDGVYHQALVTCKRSSVGVIIDISTGKELAIGDVGTDPDVVVTYISKHLGVVSSSAGIASVFRFGDTPQKVGDILIASNAHTVSVDEKGNVYFPIEAEGSAVLKVYRLEE
jgi:YVTN family beta-propeller protein